MLRKLCVLGCFVLVFALSGLATAAAAEGYIDNPNYNLSFERDAAGQQIWCKISPLTGKVLAWNDNGKDFANVEISCADACDSPSCTCKDDPCTDGIIKLTMGQQTGGSNVIVWQSLNPAYDANVIIKENYLYTVSYDAFEWNEQTLKAYLFYGNIQGPNTSQNPDVNVIVEADAQPDCNWVYQTFSIEFAALPGRPYIGKPLGIRFLEQGAGWFWIDNVQIHFKLLTAAHFPNPADAATNVSKNAILKWAPGVLAKKTGGHDVYFGNTWADVNSATTATAVIFKGNQDVNNYPPGAMTLGKTYYWRIDEVNGSTLWRGDVWTFDIEGYATNPYPADGAVDVPDDVILKWTRGTDAKYHDVYFGASFTDVNSATTASSQYKTRLSKGTEQYDPVAAVGKGYFWRIDEVNTMTVKGYVWDFGVANWILVDDFESYPSDSDLTNIWKPVTTTGVTIKLNTDANFANGDGNSMRFAYSNDASPYRSHVKRTYSPALDWSYAGRSVTLMELSYYGDVHNFPDGNAYVELFDGTHTKRVYNPLLVGTTIDYNVPWAEPWQHVWNIPLKDFTGVTLSNISSILIGVGNGDGIGGKAEVGTFYFDDIKLWPPRCFLEYKPTADLTDDCRVDVKDLAVVVEEWCKTGGWFLPSPPAKRPVVEYLYEEGTGGAGTILDNTGTYGSSHDLKLGYGVNANHVLTRDVNNNPVWKTDSDPCRHYNLWFDGNVGHLLTHETKSWPSAPGGDYLAMPGLNLNSNAVTLSTWIKPDPWLVTPKKGAPYYEQKTGWTGLIHTRSGASGSDGNSIAGLHYLGDGAAYNGILGYTWNDDDAATWGFVDGATIPDWQWSMVAVVIEPEQATLYLVDTNNTPADHNDDTLLSATNPVANDQEQWDGHFACIAADGGYVNGMGGWQTRALRGQLDGTRVYDYSLTTAEILGLSGMTKRIYLPLNSDADLCVGNKNPTYPNVNDQIDFCDYSKFADEWLVETLWPQP